MANGCREAAELMMFGWLPLLLWLLLLLLLEFAMNSVLSCDRLRFWLEPLMEECDDADGDCDKAMSRAMSNPKLPSPSPSSSPSSHHRHRDHCSAHRKHPVWHKRPPSSTDASSNVRRGHAPYRLCQSDGFTLSSQALTFVGGRFLRRKWFLDDESSTDVVRRSSGTPKQWTSFAPYFGGPHPHPVTERKYLARLFLEL